MSKLHLVRTRKSQEYPKSVRELAAFVRANKCSWPLVAHYLYHVLPTDSEEVKAQTFDKDVHFYMLDERMPDPTICELRELLEELYSLPTKRIDPRTLFIEYFVYQAGPLNSDMEKDSDFRREYQCSVFKQSAKGDSECIAKSDATFDVAFLSCRSFEGYECKVKLRNHITYSAPISQWDKKIVRKLDFMKATYSSLAKTGRTSSVYLASLDRVTQPINDAIRQNGYGCISIIGPDELESIIV